MCRIAVIPPHFDRSEAIDILRTFEGGNTDGTGYVYVKDGKFVVHKWAKPFSKVLKKTGNKFFDHLPEHNGITLCHLRAATHGEIAPKNTHPFVVGNRAYVHNGVWGTGSESARLAIKGEIEGETDSVIAAHCIDASGMEKFINGISYGGVFVALALDGTLEIGKASGTIKILKISESGINLLATNLGIKYKGEIELPDGITQFDNELKKTNFIAKKVKTYSGQNWVSRGTCGGYYQGCDDGDWETDGGVARQVSEVPRVITGYQSSGIGITQPTKVHVTKDQTGVWERNGNVWTKRYFTKAELEENAAKKKVVTHSAASTATVLGKVTQQQVWDLDCETVVTPD